MSVTAHENDVTDRLIGALSRCSGGVTARFLGTVCGVEPDTQPAGWEYRGRTEREDLGNARAIVVGLCPTGQVTWPGRKTSPASIVDAVIAAPSDLVALVEVKTVGDLDGEQLVRHAEAWGLEADLDRGADRLPTRGVVVTTWARLEAWLAGELAGASGEDRRTLGGLRAWLGQVGVLPASACDTDAEVAAHPVPMSQRPHPARLHELTRGADLGAVARACRSLYGQGGSHYRGAADCAVDAAEVVRAYEMLGIEPPAGLYDRHDGVAMNVITPRRALSVLYGGGAAGARHVTTDDWRQARNRFLERGASRAVLLGMWAWATTHPSKAADRLLTTTPLLWPQAEPHSPAAPELEEALARLGLAALLEHEAD